MRVDNAKMLLDGLLLETTDPAARRFVWDFKPGEYEIVIAKKKRSLNANAMCWKLCTDIAAVVGLTKEEVYQRAIKEIGEYTPLPIKAEAVADFTRIWNAHGIGWPVEVIDDSKLPGYKLLFCYHGSSTYDVKSMNRLLDYLIQDAKSVGLDVMSEREKALLLEDWGCENDK